MPVASGYDNLKLGLRQQHRTGPEPLSAAHRPWHDDAAASVSLQTDASGYLSHNAGSAAGFDAGQDAAGRTRTELIERIKSRQGGFGLPHGDHGYTSRAYGNPFESRLEDGRHFESLTAMSSEGQVRTEADEKLVELASSIERPRSALHRGDFHGGEPSSRKISESRASVPNENDWLGTSPPAPWLSHRLAPTSVHETPAPRLSDPFATSSATVISRPRAISNTLRSSFVFRAPTSPLANHSNSADIDSFHTFSRDTDNNSPERSSRRHTFSPTSMKMLLQDQPESVAATSPRKHDTFPYQAHQPRRSLASLDEKFSPTGIWARSAHTRRPSLSSESSPLQRAPMIGRYEESILRGRMSSLPSRPLDFVAQIGVLGKGNCKSSLRCPPHVTVPFPAIFYHYGNLPGSVVGDGPSPYVGLVDLEKNNQTAERARKSRRKRSPEKRHAAKDTSDEMELDHDSQAMPMTMSRKSRADARKQEGPKGGYRIPEQGQIQVIIRNPNKTAVKLFLVPYDLAGMQPGQKTFIRQRSYSAGPILTLPLDAKKEPASDKGVPVLPLAETLQDRPVLRYLIHLHICCTSRGRFYLYRNIRVVFANRVPDGKEKLRQEIQLPEPKFSAYKRDAPLGEGAHDQQDPMFRLNAEADGQGISSDRSKTFASGLECSAGSRPNFAWDTYAQQESNMNTVHSLPPNLSYLSSANEPRADISDVDMQEQAAETSPRTSNASSTLLDFTRSPTRAQALFERLGREDWTPSGAPPRTQSPQPGEGLISRQHRVWTTRKESPD